MKASKKISRKETVAVTKTVKNMSVQGLEVYKTTATGPEAVWLGPRQSIVIPESQIGSQIQNLAKMRMVKVF